MGGMWDIGSIIRLCWRFGFTATPDGEKSKQKKMRVCVPVCVPVCKCVGVCVCVCVMGEIEKWI